MTTLVSARRSFRTILSLGHPRGLRRKGSYFIFLTHPLLTDKSSRGCTGLAMDHPFHEQQTKPSSRFRVNPLEEFHSFLFLYFPFSTTHTHAHNAPRPHRIPFPRRSFDRQPSSSIAFLVLVFGISFGSSVCIISWNACIESYFLISLVALIERACLAFRIKANLSLLSICGAVQEEDDERGTARER